MKIKITVDCCLCSNKHETEIDLPKNWKIRYDGMNEENGFCPEHIKIYDFAEAQCPGCVGGWHDCTLWKDFAYNEHNLIDEDFKVMRTGVCPKRTNGTFSFDSGTGEFKDIDLANIAENESGIALEKAIKDYWKRYPLKSQ
jgi:hypothetical protein